MNFSSNQLTIYIVDAIILIIAGAGEYLKLVPTGIFYSLLLLVAGHVFGVVPTSVTANALNANTHATQENTAIVAGLPMLQSTTNTEQVNKPLAPPTSTIVGGPNA